MLYFLIVFILMVVFLIILFSSIYLTQKNKRKKFDLWLLQKNFAVSQKFGGELHYFFKNTHCLLVDIYNQKICKHLEPIIFNFSEILSAEINKNNLLITNTQSDTSGKIKGGIILPRAKINSNTSSKSITKDESTYDVFIRTNNVLNPLIMIPCGKDSNEAYKVYSCIESILNNRNEPKNQ